jgi:hypothetical protein
MVGTLVLSILGSNYHSDTQLIPAEMVVAALLLAAAVSSSNASTHACPGLTFARAIAACTGLSDFVEQHRGALCGGPGTRSLAAATLAEALRFVLAGPGCAAQPPTAHASPRNTLVVQAVGNVGARLHAYASARALASRTGRVLCVVWERDALCPSAFDDLIKQRPGEYVLGQHLPLLFERPDGLFVRARAPSSASAQQQQQQEGVLISKEHSAARAATLAARGGFAAADDDDGSWAQHSHLFIRAEAADGDPDAAADCLLWLSAVRACSGGLIALPARLCATDSLADSRARATYSQLVQAVFGCGLARRRKTLVVHAMHGQSNRLRAYASARLLASRTKRLLVLVWERDVHCAASIGDLFQLQSSTEGNMPPQVPAVLNALALDALVLELFDDALFPHAVFARYNYMLEPTRASDAANQSRHSDERRGKYALIRDVRADHEHIYVRSAYVLNSQSTGNHRRPLLAPRLSEPLRALVPAIAVRALLHRHAAQVAAAPNSSVIGVHVRMLTDMRIDVPGILKVHDAERGYEAMLAAVPYRNACHWRAFAPAMRQACGGAPSCSFYVASDDASAVWGLREEFERTGRHRVLSLDRDSLLLCAVSEGKNASARRGPRCQQAALADQLALASGAYLLTSTWSSFSELVPMWSPRLTGHTKCGCARATTLTAPRVSVSKAGGRLL